MGEIDSLRHHLSCYFHGLCRGTVVFKHTGVMDDTGVNTLRHRLAYLLFIQQTEENLAGGAGPCLHDILSRKPCIGHMMVHADTLFGAV